MMEEQDFMQQAIDEARLGAETQARGGDTLHSKIKAIIDNGREGLGSPDEDIQAVTQIADEFIAGKTSKFLSEGTLDFDTASDLGRRFNQGRMDDALAGLTTRLDPEVAPENAEALVKARMEKNKAAAQEQIDGLKAFVSSKFAEQGSVATVAQAGEMLFNPVQSVEAVRILRDSFPELTQDLGIDNVAIGSAVKSVAKFLLELEDPDEVRTRVNGLMRAIKDRAGIFDNNLYMMENIATQLESQLNDPSAFMAGLNNTFQVLELLPIASGIRSAARGVTNLTGQGVQKGADALLTRLGVEINPASPADIAAHTPEGAKRLLAANDDVLKRMGTDSAQVTGSLVLPKTASDTTDSGAPYLFGQLTEQFDARVPEALKEKTAELMAQPRVNTASVNMIDDNGTIEVTMNYGNAKGQGFKREADAKRLASSFKELPTEVVKGDDGRYFVKITAKDTLGFARLDEFTDADVRSGWWRQFAGKANEFSTRLVQSSNVAATRTAQVEGKLRKNLKPYDKLPAQQRNVVGEVLRQEDMLNKEFSLDELYAKGFNKKMIQAYQSVRNTVADVLSLKNHNLRTRLKLDGFASFRKGDNSYLLKPNQTVAQGEDVLDLASGNMVKKGDDADQFDYFTVYGGDDARIARLPKGTTLDDLPQRVLGNATGYLPRLYQAPFFIREKVGDKFVTRYTAQSFNEAKEAAAQLGEGFEVFRTGNVMSQVAAADELEELASQGLLYTSKRRQLGLTDYAGNPSGVINPADAINALVNQGGRAAGITSWTVQATKMWDSTFSKEFGAFSMFSRPKMAEVSPAASARYAKAKRLHDFIQMVNGVQESQVSALFNGALLRVSDSLSNFGPVGQTLAREISGQSQKVTSFGKTLAFTAYIGLNPLRALPMQMTMIPTYVGVKGGLRYASGGKFFRDMTILTANPSTKEGYQRVAKLTGMKIDEVERIAEGYRRSGLEQQVDNHVFAMGTLMDSNVAKAGMLGDAASTTINTFKRFGFDAGVRADKRATYLFSLNRFKETNGKFPTDQKEWDEVIGFAEQLSMSQNRADTITGQNGLAGLFTQFMGHQFKMAGRILGQEAGFTASEKAGMATVTLLMYGAGGYGAYQAADSIFESLSGKTLKQVSDEIKEKEGIDFDLDNAIRDGMLGWTIDKMMQLGTEEDVDLATSGTFSPANMGLIGITPDSLMKVFSDGMVLSMDGLAGSIVNALNAPAMGVSKSVYDTLKFASIVAGHDMIPTDEKALVIATKAMSSLPITSNLLKGIIGMEIGARIDSKGNPVVEASKRELMAQLFVGVPNATEEDLRFAMEMWYGAYAGTDSDGVSQEVRKEAEKYGDAMVTFFNSVASKERDLTEMIEIMQGYNFVKKHLHESNRVFFEQVVLNKLDKSGIMKSEAFKQQLYQAMHRGTVLPDGDFRQILQKTPMSEEDKNFMLETFKRMGASE